jgi:hypothetical protein
MSMARFAPTISFGASGSVAALFVPRLVVIALSTTLVACARRLASQAMLARRRPDIAVRRGAANTR